MEQIGTVGRTVFINDSKATNADSTRGALAGGEGIFWILGGKAKEGGIAGLRPLFGAVAKAYLIGAASDLFAATLDGVVPNARCGTLDVAVAQAAEDAAASGFANPMVLLSPACASYDQYKSFEHRGRHFRDLVAALPGFTPTLPTSANGGR
jgi:UDP-N-acetylmuramoylalanine--D-glutamate ligase